MAKRTNSDPQNNAHKIKDQASRSPLNVGGELRRPEEWADPAPLVAPLFIQ